MKKALPDPVASPLMSETWKRSAASFSAEHVARTADSSLPTGAEPGCQTRHLTAGIRVAPVKHTSRTSSFTVLAFALAAIACAAGICAIDGMNRSLGSPPIMTATPPLLPSAMPAPPPAPVADAAAPVVANVPMPVIGRPGPDELNTSENYG